MNESSWGLALWLWLLGAPVVGALVELGRNGAPSRPRYESASRSDAATPIR